MSQVMKACHSQFWTFVGSEALVNTVNATGLPVFAREHMKGVVCCARCSLKAGICCIVSQCMSRACPSPWWAWQRPLAEGGDRECILP